MIFGIPTIVFVLPLCMVAAYYDLKSMRIPNVLTIVGVAVFALLSPFLGGMR